MGKHHPRSGSGPLARWWDRVRFNPRAVETALWVGIMWLRMVRPAVLVCVVVALISPSRPQPTRMRVVPRREQLTLGREEWLL